MNQRGFESDDVVLSSLFMGNVECDSRLYDLISFAPVGYTDGILVTRRCLKIEKIESVREGAIGAWIICSSQCFLLIFSLFRLFV